MDLTRRWLVKDAVRLAGDLPDRMRLALEEAGFAVGTSRLAVGITWEDVAVESLDDPTAVRIEIARRGTPDDVFILAGPADAQELKMTARLSGDEASLQAQGYMVVSGTAAFETVSEFIDLYGTEQWTPALVAEALDAPHEARDYAQLSAPGTPVPTYRRVLRVVIEVLEGARHRLNRNEGVIAAVAIAVTIVLFLLADKN